jgi:uncharacterized protein YndB with AHSA1/START domain
VVRLARLAAARGGTVVAADVEQDELLARDRGTTSAVARMLASGTDVVSTPETQPRRWFPDAQLTFMEMAREDDQKSRMTSTRSTRVSRVVKAPRERVYSALVHADALAKWRFPTGKDSDRTDTYTGRFVELVPNERVVEIDEFETDDPSLQGEMRMTISLKDVADGTEVVGLHEGIPRGVALADNELGWQSALSRLAALVEHRQ